jgi:hypothetical protein
MSDTKDKELTIKLLKDTNEDSIRSNSYRFCNLEDIRKNLGGEDNQFVDHNSSILSPAAYFVDLMMLIKNKVLLDKLDPQSLWTRRKDLWEIELDTKNTIAEVPYLEIVNNVMKKHLKSQDTSALQQLSEAQFSFNLPYNAPIESIRTYLEHLDVKLTDIYETLGLAKNSEAWIAETLNLYPKEFNDSIKTPMISSSQGCILYLDTCGLLSLAQTDKNNPYGYIPDELKGISIKLIGASNNFSVAVKENGTVAIWGSDFIVRLLQVPMALEGVSVKAIAAGDEHILVLKSDNTLFTWRSSPSSEKTAIPPSYKTMHFKAIAAGYDHSVALTFDGTVVSWGRDSEGETKVPEGLKDVVAIAAGASHTVALTSHGKVVSWGSDYNGLNTTPNELKDEVVTAIAAGASSTIALKSDGTVIVWGTAGIRSTVPAGLKNVTSISCSCINILLALKCNGEIIRWGWGKSHDTIHMPVPELSQMRILKNRGKLAQVKNFSKKYELPVDVVCSLVVDMSEEPGLASGNQPALKSLFDRVFNTPEPTNPWKNTETNPWDSTSRDQKNLGIRNSLLGALNVNNDELQAILDHICDIKYFPNTDLRENPKSVKLNVSVLTRLFRFSKVAKVLGMKVQVYLVFLKSLNTPEIKSFKDLNTLDYWSKWFMSAGLSPYHLHYIVNWNDQSIKFFYPALKDNSFFSVQKTLYDTLDPRLIRIKSFKSTSIDSKTAEKVFNALCANGLLVDIPNLKGPEPNSEMGKLVYCPMEEAEKSTDELLNISITQVKKALSNVFINSKEFEKQTKEIETIRELLNNELDFQMQTTIKQLSTTFAQNWSYIANAVDFISLKVGSDSIAKFRSAQFIMHEDGLKTLAQLLSLPKALKLSDTCFRTVLNNKSLFNLNKFSFQTVHRVQSFSSLVQAFEKQGNQDENTAKEFVKIIKPRLDSNNSPKENAAILEKNFEDYKALQNITGWDSKASKALLEHFTTKQNNEKSKNSLNAAIALIEDMKNAFDLAKKLGVDINLLIEISKIDKDTKFDALDDLSHGLKAIVKSKYSEDKWEKIYEPIRNRLNERERDALVSLLMYQLGNNEDSKNYFNNMDSPQDLSDFLLIDVEMSGVAKISKVKQGINTLQRYIQRCHMGLEKGGEITCTVNDAEWQWRSHYRLWEANRKVFLYPENYIDPGLRKIKTPLFKKLEEELLQGDVTNETVTNAYLNYFDKLEELANLQTVDSCGEKVITPSAPDGVETHFFIGKTSGDTPKYFYRSASIIDKQPATWSPWQEIHLSITGENVICHFSNDRLYLYWTEKNKITERDEDTRKALPSTTVTIKYSYLNVSGSWLAPLVLEKKLLDPEVTKTSHICWFELTKNSLNEKNIQDGLILKWNKDYDLELYTARKFCNFEDLRVSIIFIKTANIFCEYMSGQLEEYKSLNEFKHGYMRITRGFYNNSSNYEINPDNLDKILLAQSTYQAFNPDFEEKNKYDAKKGFFSQFTSQIVQKGVDGFLMDKHLQALLLALPGQDLPEENKDFVDSYSVYFKEIFFHIPFLVADTLNHNQQFKDSQKWYHYIFNPIAHEDSTKMSKNSVWNYHPFKNHSIETFDAMLKNNDELAIYKNDPFDPHAIAGVRLGAYEKAIVMKYIDNLLDWGDQLYAQDNWESIVQAMLLYVLAQDLLGKRPRQAKQNYIQEPVQTFPPKGKGDAEVSHSLTLTFNSSDAKYFPIAANMSFAAYWDRADDRLFKIRHSMNIKGIVRQMALFQPAIDPSQLMRALASGGDIASITNQLSAAVPHYRFSIMIQHAKSLTSTLSQLGSALLSAFEKKDAEQLNLLRLTQEKATLNLTTKIKEKQIEDAGKSLDSLNASLGSATSRKKHYEATISKGLITQEETSLSLTESALKLHTAAHQIRGAAVAAHLIPTVFGFADGSFQPGASVSEAATLLDAIAGIDSERAGLASIQGQNKRRVEDWALQLALATYDVTQIEAQIEGAQIKLEISQKDLDMHQQSIAQAKEREEMIRGKFSNQDLYQWMVGQISSVYFQTYKMAFDMAKSAEKAYQYERNTEDTIITSSYWNSLKHGLMAGEGLMLGINQLEKTYLDEDERALEIEKTISLLNLYTEQEKNHLLLKYGLTDKGSKQVLDKLIVKDFQKKLKEGKYTFPLTEQLFNEDFPGHYCRKIKSIAITIPAVVGPYQNLPATLTQMNNRVLLEPDINGVKFLNKRAEVDSDKLAEGDSDKVRSDWRKQQKIAISKAVNDSGLFELNFHDERYLPFEGTGAVSDWELEMCGSNKTVLDTVSDVIIHIKYTALDGGETFKSDVLSLHKST